MARGLNPHVHTQGECSPAAVTRIADGFPRTLYPLAAGACMSAGTEDIDAQSEVPWHEHAEAEEVLYCTAGNGLIYVGSSDPPAPFVPGTLAFVPRHTPHRIVNLSSTDVLSLVFCLSPPRSVQQFRAGAVTEPWLLRHVPWLFRKKT
jgi:quercetin dioxygenase-like cupin family protein